MPLVHCIYASAATRELGGLELVELLQRSRENNERQGLTGMLLYTEGSFFQVLEGEPGAVDALYEKIALDRRHDRVTKIIREPIETRAFAEWTMGFSHVSRREVAGIVGANDFFRGGGCLTDIDAGRAKQLLAGFREGRWHAAPTGHR